MKHGGKTPQTSRDMAFFWLGKSSEFGSMIPQVLLHPIFDGSKTDPRREWFITQIRPRKEFHLNRLVYLSCHAPPEN